MSAVQKGASEKLAHVPYKPGPQHCAVLRPCVSSADAKNILGTVDTGEAEVGEGQGIMNHCLEMCFSTGIFKADLKISRHIV